MVIRRPLTLFFTFLPPTISPLESKVDFANIRVHGYDYDYDFVENPYVHFGTLQKSLCLKTLSTYKARQLKDEDYTFKSKAFYLSFLK